jgi:hypothetical protein
MKARGRRFASSRRDEMLVENGMFSFPARPGGTECG